jgi:hypothetical protein
MASHAQSAARFPAFWPRSPGWLTAVTSQDEELTIRIRASTAAERAEGHRFEHIVLLSAPVAVSMQRLRDRTNNPCGRSSAEQAETARYVETVEHLVSTP